MPTFAGIDVSKDFLDLALGEGSEVERLPNSAAGVRIVVERLRRADLQSVAIESTGGYERRVLRALQAAQVSVSLVNPWRVRRFGEALGLLAKTDAIDGRLLARFARQVSPPRTAPRSAETLQLAAYTSRRRQLIAMIVAEKARLENAEAWLRKSIADVVGLLDGGGHRSGLLLRCQLAPLRSERSAGIDHAITPVSAGSSMTRFSISPMPSIAMRTTSPVCAWFCSSWA